jgi:hypothetical protein
MNTKPGDVIIVQIEGKDYKTVIDNRGVQRFPGNSVLQYMFDHNTDGEKSMQIGSNGYIKHDSMLNLNTLSLAFAHGKFDKREYMEIVMPGYSVSGFCDLSQFQDWHIMNPVWGDTEPSLIGGES